MSENSDTPKSNVSDDVVRARIAAMMQEEDTNRGKRTRPKRPRGYNPVFKILGYGLTGSMLDYAGIPYGFWIGIGVGVVIVFFI